MTTQTILEEIQLRAGLDSPERARGLAIAVLANLNRYDLNGQEHGFAAELPQEFGEVLLNDTAQKEQPKASIFVQRVADRVDISTEQSESWTRATLSLLVESVSPGQREKIIAALPEELKPYTIWDV